MISVHWLTGLNTSHVRIDGEELTDSKFMANIKKIGEPYLGVFSLNDRNKYRYDIKFYGMRVVEGHPSAAEIEEVCDSMMAEHGLK